MHCERRELGLELGLKSVVLAAELDRCRETIIGRIVAAVSK